MTKSEVLSGMPETDVGFQLTEAYEKGLAGVHAQSCSSFWERPVEVIKQEQHPRTLMKVVHNIERVVFGESRGNKSE